MPRNPHGRRRRWRVMPQWMQTSIVMLVRGGVKKKEVARRLQIDPQGVRRWFARLTAAPTQRVRCRVCGMPLLSLRCRRCELEANRLPGNSTGKSLNVAC